MYETAFYSGFCSDFTTALKNDANINSQVFEGFAVHVRSSDGRIQLSSMCACAGKQTSDYLRLKRTKEFIARLKHDREADDPNLVYEPIIKEASNHNSVYWGDILVALDVASWISHTFHTRTLKWVYDIMSTGSTSITSNTSTQEIDNNSKNEIVRLQNEIKKLGQKNNLLKMRRRRPQLPTGSGVYLCMTESEPNLTKIGMFESSMNKRYAGYHTHSMTPVQIKAILYSRYAKGIETYLLELLADKRRNSNEVVDLPYTTVLKLLQAQLTTQHVLGETDAYIVDESSDILKEFNDTTRNIDLDEEPDDVSETKAEPSCKGNKTMGTINGQDVVRDLQTMTLVEVSNKYNISVSTVHRIRRKAGVQAHSRGHPAYNIVFD